MERYQKLAPIIDFNKITSDQGFLDAPLDWFVVLTDLRGSTKAIEEGRYKDVNLIGAASIAVIKNILGTRDFPFVFGGDGATFILPPDKTEKIKSGLSRLQNHAKKSFSLNLRIGIVSVSEIVARGGKIQIGKYQLNPGSSIGLFRGGGLQIAENMIKEDTIYKYVLPENEENDSPPLKDLSCRWAPIANRNGTIISVVIQVKKSANSSEIYQKILQEIYPIFDSKEYSPVHYSGMRLESLWRNIKRELNLRKELSFWRKIKLVILPNIIVRMMAAIPFGPGAKKLSNYLDEKIRTSDYKKMDDSLKMVLDCSVKQADELTAILNAHYSAGEIYFGIHRSDSALMTCIVESMNSGDHIHFIDGSDGGYAMAAKQLKKQLIV
ncbi:MAG: DUF3095 domain-containing protein [Bdellovibrionota bacterium]